MKSVLILNTTLNFDAYNKLYSNRLTALGGRGLLYIFFLTIQNNQTVGYGDIELTQHGTHITVGIYTFLSTILLAFAIKNLTDVYYERKHLLKIKHIAEKKATLESIKELDTGNGVPRDTFVLAVLEQLGVLDRENDILPWIKVSFLIL